MKVFILGGEVDNQVPAKEMVQLILLMRLKALD